MANKWNCLWEFSKTYNVEDKNTGKKKKKNHDQMYPLLLSTLMLQIQ